MCHYTIGDVISRFSAICSRNGCTHGLGSLACRENAAMKNKVAPSVTYDNIDTCHQFERAWAWR